jgi:hypothetical protein
MGSASVAVAMSGGRIGLWEDPISSAIGRIRHDRCREEKSEVNRRAPITPSRFFANHQTTPLIFLEPRHPRTSPECVATPFDNVIHLAP